MLLDFYPDLRSSICSWLQKTDLINLSLCCKECHATVQPWLWSTVTVPHRYLIEPQPVLPAQLETFCDEISYVNEWGSGYEDEDEDEMQETLNAKAQIRDRLIHVLESCNALKVLKFEVLRKELLSIFASDEILHSISHMKNLGALHLVVLDDDSHFDDAINNFILNCPGTLRELSIEVLEFWGGGRHTPCFANIKRLSELQELTIIVHTVPEDAFKDFCSLPLIKLRLEDCWLTDDHVRHVSLLQNIVELDFRENRKISNASLAHITRLSGLESLTLTRTGVCDRGLRSFMPALIRLKLKKLHISSTKTSDFLFESLSGLEHLTDLNVSSTVVHGNKLFHLRHLPITRLNLGQNSIHLENLKQLHDFTNLRYLDLSQLHHNRFDHALLEALKLLITELGPTLKVLNIMGTVTPAQSELIRERNSSVQVIS